MPLRHGDVLADGTVERLGMLAQKAGMELGPPTHPHLWIRVILPQVQWEPTPALVPAAAERTCSWLRNPRGQVASCHFSRPLRRVSPAQAKLPESWPREAIPPPPSRASQARKPKKCAASSSRLSDKIAQATAERNWMPPWPCDIMTLRA